MTLSYQWRPDGTIRKLNLVPGDVLPWEHAAYRVIEVRPLADPDRPTAVRLRPVRDDSHGSDLHLAVGQFYHWSVYPDPDHYPVCSTCGEPTPCRTKMAEITATEAGKRMDRYSMPGCCPVCREPVTQQQKSVTFAENLEVPGGPPVTFHLREKCVLSAVVYERRWQQLDPQNRRCQLSCPGHITVHNEGTPGDTYECSEWPDCPGPQAAHHAYSVCECPDCHARGPFGCKPRHDAQHVDRRIP